MADAKISQLPVATTPLAGTELVPVVQGGVTDQTTVEAILTGTVPSGTANGVLYLDGSKVVTSGSALTFDGSLLKLGSGAALSVQGVAFPASGSGAEIFWDGSESIVQSYNRTSSAYVPLWLESSYTRFGINGSEQMRLTSTGLGIGTSSPGARLNIVGSPDATFNSQLLIGNSSAVVQKLTFNPTVSSGIAGLTDGALAFYANGANTERMRLDSSGNLGLGVTPSASTRGKGFDIGLSGGLYGDGITFNHSTHLTSNAYPLANGSWIYKNSSQVAQLYSMQSDGSHLWFTAPSGTAGNAISFTQAMTLDASGNLGVGVTGPAVYTVGSRLLQIDGGANATELKLTNNTTGNAGGDGTLLQLNGLAAYFWNLENSFLSFGTNNTERARITSGGNFKIGGSADRATTEGDKQLVLFDGTAPVGTLANGVSFYSASGEANVMDAAGNATLLSPHDAETNEWIFRSKHTPTGKVLKIDVERLLKFVNDHFGLDAVHEFVEA